MPNKKQFQKHSRMHVCVSVAIISVACYVLEIIKIQYIVDVDNVDGGMRNLFRKSHQL